MNYIAGTSFHVSEYILPLAISFFTFEQITYLFYCYNSNTVSLLDYSLFITFFPKLIAGPILYPEEMIPQYVNKENKTIDARNIEAGLNLFFTGLFKKVVIADTLAAVAINGYDKMGELTMITSWATALSYTLQLYYDFSGYTDMARGAALLFNIHLPFNFDSPYKSTNIQEFWRTWHITLSRFLRKYIYIPLGGNKISGSKTYLNLITVFLIGGLWHGAGWTFILWGLLHGVAMAVNRMWQTTEHKMNKYLGWFLTFNFVNITWVFFRAKDFSAVVKILTGMSGYYEIREILATRELNLNMIIAALKNSLHNFRLTFDSAASYYYYIFILAGSLIFSIFFKNTNSISKDKVPSYTDTFTFLVLTIVSMVYVFYDINVSKPFLYFNF
ncbi:MBOAT family O-acyltransferase [Candidatus Magnetomonas plexicatena]|uniref:MBOAT family O-acyltransferase n=1 Tax=Candidatus Magnetomonas plexicatena TaxID=2552947 RepID=UPI004032E6FB